jgi:ankyrin repeat protein
MEFYPPIDWARHPLHAASFSGNADEVRRLIAKGADVNEQLEQDINGRQDVAGSPLHTALRSCAYDSPAFAAGDRHLDVITTLLAAGADVRSQRKWEGTPLHDAARFGLIHVAELLIAAGADVDSHEDAEQRTPLYLAAANGRLHMVDYLLSRGAAVDAVADCKPPQHAAIRFSGAGAKTALQAATEAGHLPVVKRLLDAGARDDGMALKLAVTAKQASNDCFDEIIALLNR